MKGRASAAGCCSALVYTTHCWCLMWSQTEEEVRQRSGPLIYLNGHADAQKSMLLNISHTGGVHARVGEDL